MQPEGVCYDAVEGERHVPAGCGLRQRGQPGVTRSLAALSLEGLRKRIMVVALQKRRAGEEVTLTMLLDSAAQREWDRRQGPVRV